ncbi:hypothetical protein [Streptomyces sp. ODS28]|uniref:hypothetical protein n=1 Tax=Streptomyces sp. ODS28 TaxID=3136688 RepID=UPI0031EBF353
MGALLAGAAGCGPPEEPHRAERDHVQKLLDRQARAVRDKDERAYLASVSPGPGERGYRDAQRDVFRNLERLPLAEWSYRASGVQVPRDGGFTAQVRLSYRLRGHDRAPVTTTERLAFDKRGGRWYLTGELPGSAPQLWEQGRIRLVRGERSLVLGVGRDEDELRSLAREADRAVTAVAKEWPHHWPHRVVLEVPGSLRRMAELLDAPASSYQGIAAVTTGEAGASERAPADRIVVNPEAYGLLGESGRQVVMTHETVHVATRTATSDATPLWLSEGLADWVAYRGGDSSPRQVAPELARAVRASGPPRTLPSDRDFRFGGDQQTMGRAYEGSWLACRMIADLWGTGRLAALYRKVGEGERHDPARLDRVLREELGVSTRKLTAWWRDYLERELG